MLKYNICFVKRGDEILLLNREKASWMGCWNGIGGKLEPMETPREAMIRFMLNDTHCYDHHCEYENGQLQNLIQSRITSEIESNEKAREQYLQSYYDSSIISIT
jgi:hypothetical protein